MSKCVWGWGREKETLRRRDDTMRTKSLFRGPTGVLRLPKRPNVRRTMTLVNDVDFKLTGLT